MTIPELEKQLRQRDAKQLRQRDALIKEQARRIKELEKKIEELKELLVEKAKSKESKPPKEAMNYGVGQHERKKRKKQRRKKSPGRVPINAQPFLLITARYVGTEREAPAGKRWASFPAAELLGRNQSNRGPEETHHRTAPPRCPPLAGGSFMLLTYATGSLRRAEMPAPCGREFHVV